MYFINLASSFSTPRLTIKKSLWPLQLAIKLAIYYTAAHKTQLRGYSMKGLIILAPRTYKSSKKC